MENAVFYPSVLSGDINIPGSKSETHRYMIAAALSDGDTVIENPLICKDTAATWDCIEKMGGKVMEKDGNLVVSPIRKSGDFCRINCGESGSTARFFIPVLSVLRKKSEINGENSLLKRPFDEIIRILSEKGSDVEDNGNCLPISVKGSPKYGDFVIEKNISSQIASGLLFALPFLEGDSRIIFKEHPDSEQYIRLTSEILMEFSIDSEYKDGFIFVPGNQKYVSPGIVRVREDCSFENLWYCAKKICSGINIIKCRDSSERKFRPEGAGKRYIDLIFDSKNDKVFVDAGECIDSVPIMAVASCATDKTVTISGIKRLIYKESDRFEGLVSMISDLGGVIHALNSDTLEIKGHGYLEGGKVDSRNDHRMVMSGALASLISRGKIEIANSGAISKSYPDFINNFKRLGGRADVIDVRQ